MKKNNIIAIGIVFFVGLLLLIFSIKSSNKVNNYKLLEAPVHINSINVSIRISNEDNNLKSVYGEAPKSGNDEDIEILKYKVSLKNGTYMEYDQTTNTYNWS